MSRNGFPPWGGLSSATGCLWRMWSLHPWKYSKAIWTKSWATVALPKQRICMRCKHWGFSKHNLSWHTVIIALLIKEGCTKYSSKQIHSHAITCCVDSVTEFEHADFCYKSHRGCWQSKFKENFFTDPQTFGTHVFPQVGNQFSQYLYSFRNGFLPALSVPDWVNLQKWFLLSCR